MTPIIAEKFKRLHSLETKLIPIAITLVFLTQLVLLYLFLRPINLYNQLSTVKVINEITENVPVPPNELPQIGIIGDGKNLQSIDELKQGNEIDADIFRDAQNGDYVLGYTSKLIIYRPADDKVIYNGDTPQQKIGKLQEGLIAQVQKKALAENLITKETPIPQANVVTDVEKVRASNELYKDVELNDIIANFSNPDLIVVYRPSTDTIVKTINITLQAN